MSHLAPFGHALSASVLLVLSPLGGHAIDVGSDYAWLYLWIWLSFMDWQWDIVDARP